MTSAELLQNLRTRLDEASPGFWTDAECYTALTNAELEIIRILANKRSPVIRPLISVYSVSPINSTSVSLPSDFFLLYSVKAHPTGGTEKPCWNREGDRYRDADNPYLSSEDDELYYAVYGSNLVFEKSFTNGTATIDYVRKPAGISVDTEPEIDSIAHNLLVLFAYASLLPKAKLQAEADSVYKLFYETIGLL